MKWFSGPRRQRQQEQEIARLRADNTQLQARVAALEAENARLLAQLAAARKHSGNSSKPPSSDIVKPKDQRRKQKGRRRIGAQKGHPKHQRPAFAPEQVDRRIAYRLQRCPVNPSHRISPAQGPEHQRTLQQVELVEKPFAVIEHTA
jgi:transposase